MAASCYFYNFFSLARHQTGVGICKLPDDINPIGVQKKYPISLHNDDTQYLTIVLSPLKRYKTVLAKFHRSWMIQISCAILQRLNLRVEIYLYVET